MSYHSKAWNGLIFFIFSGSGYILGGGEHYFDNFDNISLAVLTKIIACLALTNINNFLHADTAENFTASLGTP
jgi:hypothetical protein